MILSEEHTESMMKVAIVDDDVFDLHIPISRLPETPGRTVAISSALHERFDKDIRVDFLKVPAFDNALKFARNVHAREYLDYLKSSCSSIDSSGEFINLSACADVVASRDTMKSVEACIRSVLMATRYVLTNQYNRIFCNIRPPGHHACADRAMGFCIINNVAIAAKYAISGTYPNISRCAIVDWDVHHGNGTQEIFSANPNVLYMSLHMHGPNIYPETGSSTETGMYDNVCNYPMREGADQTDVDRVFLDSLLPKLTAFAPDVIFISCGFDAHRLDPIGILNYEDTTYEWMTREIVKVADQVCKGRVISVLEGGYNPASLASASIAHVTALL